MKAILMMSGGHLKASHSTAMNLFRETVGSEIADRLEKAVEEYGPPVQAAVESVARQVAPRVQSTLEATSAWAQTAAPHVQAAASATADVISDAADFCAPAVRRPVSTGYYSIVQDALEQVRYWESEVARRQKCQQEAYNWLETYKLACSGEQRRRDEMAQTLCRKAYIASAQTLGCMCVEFAVLWRWTTDALLSGVGVSALSLLLACICWAAWCWNHTWQHELENDRCIRNEEFETAARSSTCKAAKSQLDVAQRHLHRATSKHKAACEDLVAVNRDGASIGCAAKVGLHYLSKAVSNATMKRVTN